MILKAECKLSYCEGTSDKVYYIRLYNDCGEYSTICEYGRRGYSLKEVTKAIRISESRAMAEFDKVRKEKIAKGYVQEYMNWHEPTSIEPELSSIIAKDYADKVDKALSSIIAKDYADKVAKEPVIVEDVRTCSEDARQKALERLRAACANE